MIKKKLYNKIYFYNIIIILINNLLIIFIYFKNPPKFYKIPPKF